MRMFLAALILCCAPGFARAASVAVLGGQTSVALDLETLSAVGLDLSSVSSDVIAPGALGGGSVAFAINPPDAAAPAFPTTFTYDSDGFAPFSGTIEHTGSVFFNADSTEVGNFRIGFDAGRVAAGISGFFVESTVGVAAILFDVADPSSLIADAIALEIAAALLVSPEFAGFLGDSMLAGAVVGEALVQGSAIPEPTTAFLLGMGILGLATRRRGA